MTKNNHPEPTKEIKMTEGKRPLMLYQVDFDGYPMGRSIKDFLSTIKKKGFRAVFEIESHPDFYDQSIEEKAEAAGLTAAEYEICLEYIDRHEVAQRMLYHQRSHNFYYGKMWSLYMKALQWAEENKASKVIRDLLKDMQEAPIRLHQVAMIDLMDSTAGSRPVLDRAGQKTITILPIKQRDDGEDGRDSKD